MTKENRREEGILEGKWLKKVLGGTTKGKIVVIHNPLHTGSGDRDRFLKDKTMPRGFSAERAPAG